MDDCLTERLVYSESENSDDEYPPQQFKKSQDVSTANIQSTFDEICMNETKQNDESNGSDNENVVLTKKSKKFTKILSSDDEEDDSKTDGLENTLNNDSTSEKEETKIDSDNSLSNDKAPNVFKSIIRPSICDSDTKSSDEDNEPKEDLNKKKKRIKKVKKKPKKEKPQKKKASGSSGSGSDESDDDESIKKGKQSKKKHSGSGSSNSSGSGTSSNEENDENAKVAPREKVKQRMSAKVAEAQMREIQSESQRLAREAYIDVPYHKPKQYSLKEFLSRRSIAQQHEKSNIQPNKKAAAAIKMSAEELIIYAKKLEEREKEAVAFYEVEEGDSDSNDANDAETEQSEKMDVQEDTIPETVEHDKSNEIIEKNNENPETTVPTQELESPDPVPEVPISDEVEDKPIDELMENTEQSAPMELHTEKTELDLELDHMIAKERRNKLLSIVSTSAPKLSGGSGMVIDLETNEFKLKEKTGVEKLVERFVKNVFVKPAEAESQDIGIFHTESGTIETHKVLFNADDHKLKKEPKPGESYFKLQSELSRKIHEKRREAIYKRLEEEQKQKKINSEEVSDEELEEYSECGMEGNELDEEICENSPTKDEEDKCVLEAIASGSELDENDANDENESDTSASDEEHELDNQAETTGNTKRRRIVTAFNDDSDDEKAKDGIPAELQDEPQVLSGNIIGSTEDEHNKSQETDEIMTFNLSEPNISLDGSMKKSDAPKLFEDNNDEGEIGESQLMALCSGTFATQAQTGVLPTPKPVESSQIVEEEVETSKPLAILSSDEEETGNDPEHVEKEKKRQKKKQTLIYSDDEDEQMETKGNKSGDDTGSEAEEPDIHEESVDDEEDIGEKYVEYDSDENEVEVVLKKDDVKKKAANYFENEAELSESEWGSDDEEEKGMDQYEAELGDKDVFDESKIQSELERIRLRQQIDEDARDVRILTERFIEEEDNGQERERKFRWKNLNNTDLGDQSLSVDQEPDDEQAGSEDENEEEWRRQRYEREQKLKEEMEKRAATGEESTTDIAESTITNLSVDSLRRISIVKPLAPPKTVSPFLVTKTALTVGHLSRKSFLNRDSTTLAKLAGLTKSDGETIVNKPKGKGNYVFVATEKKNDSKRKSETEFESSNGASSIELSNPRKKCKLTPKSDETIRPQTKTFLDLLSK